MSRFVQKQGKYMTYNFKIKTSMTCIMNLKNHPDQEKSLPLIKIVFYIRALIYEFYKQLVFDF